CYAEYMARKYLHDKSFVDEVINDTFVNIWRSIDKFDETRNGYGLLCKTAKNFALKRNIKESRNNNVDLVETVDDNVVQDSYPPPDVEGAHDFYSAVMRLSELDRTIVEDRFLYDKTLQEIADKVGVTAATVHNRLQKSYTELKQFLSED
ncbi:MAG: sigma-70 family RNA polymerase sigma factor, partial [Clostridiales bacterium]|nr:sigma-70 family RNA polymerase sigma factor [Clostridiales bacterium]